MSQTDLPIGVYSTQEKNRKKNRRSEKQMGSYYGEVHVVWVAQTKQACIDRVHMKEKINKSYSTFQNFFQKKQNKKYTSCFSFVEISCICYMYIYSVLPPCTSNSSSSSSCRCFFYHFSLFLFARAPNSLQKNCTFLIFLFCRHHPPTTVHRHWWDLFLAWTPLHHLYWARWGNWNGSNSRPLWNIN